LSLKLFGQKRSASNSSRAAATKESYFGDASRFEARKELKNISADRICNFDGRRGSGQFASVARIAKVIENGFAEHS
jgi:hypothetical protein